MHPIFLFTHTQYFIMRLLLLINILILTACSTGMTARTSHAPESTARQTTQTSTQKISAVAAWNKSPKITRKNKATISVMERSGVKIHTYLSSHLQATYIIESKNNLVLIDSQFSKEDALDFRAYANSLNKKIERIILTHSHQDHILGYGFAFSDIEGYALEVSKKAIEKSGKTAPKRILKQGKETIDGVNYIFSAKLNSEAAENLLIELPDLKTLAVNDLAYNGLHLFLANNKLANWIKVLNELQTLKNYDTVLAGHGGVSDTQIFQANINYLNKAIQFKNESKTGDEFKNKLITEFPSLKGLIFIKFAIKAFFK